MEDSLGTVWPRPQVMDVGQAVRDDETPRSLYSYNVRLTHINSRQMGRGRDARHMC